MNSPEVFILVPSLSPTGPIKGAIALANGLADRFQVSLIALKDSGSKAIRPDPRVQTIELGGLTWIRKWLRCRELLTTAARSRQPTVISLCFSADLTASTLGRYARIISSVRGNLESNYRLSFGPTGDLLSWLHYRRLMLFDSVVPMSAAMKIQLERIGLPDGPLIPNFLDEGELKGIGRPAEGETGCTAFIFVGRLTRLKRPDLLLSALARIPAERWRLEWAGDGPLRPELEASAASFPRMVFHGEVPNPWRALRTADYLVLPSESEGVSRAVLEALYLGVPCILRDVDAASEVIEHGVNGYLFRTDEEFAGLLAEIVSGRIGIRRSQPSLLPERFRQETCVTRFAEMING